MILRQIELVKYIQRAMFPVKSSLCVLDPLLKLDTVVKFTSESKHLVSPYYY